MKKSFWLMVFFIGFHPVFGQDIFESIEYPYSVKKAEISDNYQLAYIDEGEGEVILFVHGLGSYLPAWQKNIEELKKSYRCIAVDLLGYGYSSKPEGAVDLTRQSDALHQLIQYLAIDKYSLVGHSMGGQIGMHHALSYSNHLSRLILVAPAGLETFTPAQGMMFKMLTPELIAKTSDEEIENNLKINFYQFPEEANFMVKDRIAIKKDPQFPLYAHMVVQGIQGMINQPVEDQLSMINVPVLILFGTDDALIPNRLMNPKLTTALVGEIGKSKISNSSLQMVKDAGHMLMFEKAEEVNKAIQDFLKNR